MTVNTPVRILVVRIVRDGARDVITLAQVPDDRAAMAGAVAALDPFQVGGAR